MTVRRLVLAVGAVILIVGIIGLLVPVSVSDGHGGSVGCGNALWSTNSAQTATQNQPGMNIPVVNEFVPHTDFVAECQSAQGSRRSWSIPVTVIGTIALVAAFFVRAGRSAAPGGV